MFYCQIVNSYINSKDEEVKMELSEYCLNLPDDDFVSQKSIQGENVVSAQAKSETSDSINASPSVRKLARELNCNIKVTTLYYSRKRYT